VQEPEFIDSESRPIGLLYLSRYPRDDQPGGFVYEVHIDGKLLMSSVSPLSERQLATSAVDAHPGTGLRVLVGGLGLGYTAQAALESDRVAEVRVVDLMDFVIRWLQSGLLPIANQLNADERLTVAQGDVYADLLGPPSEVWDLILVDVDHAPDMPLDPASLPFYTAAGQAIVRRHLAPGGILAVWSAFDDPEFAAVLRTLYVETWREHVKWIVPYPDEDQPLHNVLFFARRD
jgi:spermidine synthase